MRLEKCVDHTIYPSHPYSPTVVGTCYESVETNGVKRNYIMYIPSETRASCAGIMVLPENGKTAREMMENSNWIELAETDEYKEKFIVVFLEPNETWDIENPEMDLKYVHDVYAEIRLRDKCCIHEAKVYLTGYGEGGTIAQLAAMDYPAIYAGVASANATAPAAEIVEKIREEKCLDLNGYEDPDWKYGYYKKEFFVPSWIISDQPTEKTADESIALHWRKAGKTSEVFQYLRPDTVEYIREIPADWTVNQEKEAYRVWVSQIPGADEQYGNRINHRIWSEFLRGVRRWMAEPGGDLRLLADPVKTLGMEYHYEEIDGWMREYYVHVPKQVRENPEKPVPLVFANHGYTCSGEIYAGNSEWYKVADKYGFIVVFPSAAHGYLRFVRNKIVMIAENETELPAWNLFGIADSAPNDVLFFEEMLRRVSKQYAVDSKRVFVTGHSMGALMTHLLGMEKPELFAAIAPCSGVFFSDAEVAFPNREEVKNRLDEAVPIWMFGGENEEWLMDNIPTIDNETGETIRIWWDLNHVDGEKPADNKTFEEYCTVNGRWNDYFFDDDKLRYTWVSEMPHATMTEMSFRIWEEFFSKHSK